MTGRIPARAAKLAAALFAATAVSAVAAAAASASETIIYNNIPGPPQPGNVVSEAFEATQASQFGGQVEFAGASLSKTKVTVGMSSWGCQSGSWTGTPECVTTPGAKFAWPITLHIYGVGTANAVGTQIAELTKTFKMPYRPSQNNARCTGESTGAWYQMSAKECFHGKLFKIAFSLKGVSMPVKAILSISFNTSDYGEAQRPKACNGPPDNCPYDSLNIGLTEPPNEAAPTPVKPSVGEDPAPEDAYQNSQTAENYCDKGLQGTGTFRLDSGVPPCWTGYQPLFKVSTS